MSHGILGGLFSQRSQPAPPMPAGFDRAVETDHQPGVDCSFQYPLDALSCNVMFCDRELILRHLNRAALKTLRSLQEHLPVPVDKIVGKSIHIFHQSPRTSKESSAASIIRATINSPTRLKSRSVLSNSISMSSP